ncbi:MAG: tRNA-dihydrouridine synthase family protein [Treponema sp.]|jgi:tRNA-dihydrouridine synthase|nr:tRNA-dihydrouridine synthase family protein [Treponema sp.]
MTVPFLLAPMAELSHRPLRELVEGFGGCDEYFTEMISSGALIGGGQFEAFYLDTAPCPERVVFQLLGSDADQLAQAVAFLDRLLCAGIDLNMGCSAPAITRQGAGVRWMADIDRAGELIRLVRARTSRRLSVKLRIGVEDNCDYRLDFCRRLSDEGVERITLHPRTAREKFRRGARWDYVARLREGIAIPVAGNGDIVRAGELAVRAGQGICDAVMVGRAAVRMPWIFAEARVIEGRTGNGPEKAGNAGSGAASSGSTGPAPGTVNLVETGLRFLELLARHQPPEFHIGRARRFFGYFCDNLKWAHYLKTALNREQTLAGIERVWRAYFAEHPEEIRAGK